MVNNKKSDPQLGLSLRVGRGLLKFFKPLKFTPAHEHPKPEGEYRNDHLVDDFGSRSPNMEKGQDVVDKRRKRPSIREEVEESALELSQQKTPLVWLELVIQLLKLCKKASSTMKLKLGIKAYKASVAARGQEKIKSLGTIIDTVTTISEADETSKQEEVSDSGGLIDRKAG